MLVQYKVLIAIGVIILIIMAIKLRNKKAKEKELKVIAEDKLRDQALNKALANDLYGHQNNKASMESLPYEVDYNQKQLDKRVAKKGKIMLQITECSELSKRKFMIELSENIKIGRAKENPIVIKEQGALPVHCEIFAYHNEVYVRDFSGNKTILRRKRQNVYVDEHGLKLKTGDKLVIENTILEIIIIDRME